MRGAVFGLILSGFAVFGKNIQLYLRGAVFGNKIQAKFSAVFGKITDGFAVFSKIFSGFAVFVTLLYPPLLTSNY